ncbi:MAG: efflux RND transporter periplasmic adaptor subunit, partial [Bdellovibrio bacteriovorus]
GPEPSTLRTLVLDRGQVRALITATGTVRPVLSTNISTQVSGQVSEVLVDFNDTVTKGQLLARLDPQTFLARAREAQAQLEVAKAELASRESALAKAQAQLQQHEARRGVAESEAASARARHEEARRTLERRRTLAAKGGVSDSDLQSAQTEFQSAKALLEAADGKGRVQDAEIAAARAEVDMARSQADYARATIAQREAALEEARVNLSRTEIRAPLDAIVIRRDVEEGQTVAASLQAPTLFTLAQDLARMRIETYVDEADIGRVRTDQAAYFSVDAYPGRVFEGQVTSIRKAPNLIQNVVTYTVLVDAENPDLALFPGMTAVVRIVVEEVADGLRIPNAALRFVPREPAGREGPKPSEVGEGWLRVWIPGGSGGMEAVPILAGASDERFTVLAQGRLQAGDAVVIGYAED